MTELCSKLLAQVCSVIHMRRPAEAPHPSQSMQTRPALSGLRGHTAECLHSHLDLLQNLLFYWVVLWSISTIT